MENKCRVVITRPSEMMNRLRGFKLVIDGNKVAPIWNGESKEFMLDAGAHTIFAKIDWCRSRDFSLVLEPGKTVHLRVKNGMKYYLLLVIPFLITGLINIYYRSSGMAKPYWFRYVLIACLVAPLAYLFYYLSFGRKNYLVIDDDPVFSAS